VELELTWNRQRRFEGVGDFAADEAFDESEASCVVDRVRDLGDLLGGT